MVFGQLLAGEADLVDAHRVLGLRVVDEVAMFLLAEGEDLHQDERPDDRVPELEIADALVGVFDRLGIDASAGLGVVLDGESQRRVEVRDEHLVLEVDVPAVDRIVDVGQHPLELV